MVRVLVGVDEAGRGAVLGPMVIALVSIDAEEEDILHELGVKDSKKLSPKRREEIFEELIKVAQVKYLIISAKEIDERVFYSSSIDEFELSKISESLYSFLEDLIGIYGRNVIFEVFIDAPGGYANRLEYAENVIKSKLLRLSKLYGISYRIHIEPKADDSIPIVSAASIVAKVIRDREIEKLKKLIGEDFGSGYPSDPKTIGFLERVLSKSSPEYVRYSRATTKRIRESKKLLDEFIERGF